MAFAMIVRAKAAVWPDSDMQFTHRIASAGPLQCGVTPVWPSTANSCHSCPQ
jgi:hypothetical protein